MSDPSPLPVGQVSWPYDFPSAPRLYELDTPLGERLLVEAWVGREELSTLYAWHVFCLGTDLTLELKRLAGQQVRLHTRLADGGIATRSGWVSEVVQLGADGAFARYRLTLVPWLWLATQRRRSHAYQDQSVLDILAHVFAADGPRAHWRATPDVEPFLSRVRPRPSCCQYRETDYAFVSRLLAEEGIGFTFEEAPDSGHSLSDQRLVLFADSTAFPDDPQAAARGSIRFHRDAAAEQHDGIQALGNVRRRQPAITTVAGWDGRAKRVISASVPTAHRFGGPHAQHLEACDWAGIDAFASRDEAEHYAGILRDAADARFKTWFGRASVRSFRAGTAFTLTDSPLDQLPDLGPTADANPQRRRFALLGVLHAGVNNLPATLADHVAQRLGPLDPAVFAPGTAREEGEWLDRGVGRPAQPEPWTPPSPSIPPTPAELASRAFLRTHFPALYANDPEPGEGDPDTLDTAGWGRLLQHAAATGYANRFTAIRADIVWRPALFDATGLRLNPRPTAPGSQSAIVVGADGSTTDAGTVHTDRLGRIRIRYHWQQDEDAAACWVRVAQLFAGPGYGAQFIPRIGQEVLVHFYDQDIDRPVVTKVLYNGRGQQDPEAFARAGDHAPAGQDNQAGGASPAWHGAAGAHRHAGFLSGFQSVALGADGYARQGNQLVFDDSSGRLRTRLATDSAATQLNLGHLIHQADNYRGGFRGRGWELRTDAYGAIRAGKGVLLSTYYGKAPGNQPEAAGDNAPGMALLKQVQGFAEAFDRAANLHQTVQFILVKGGRLNGRSSQSAIDDKRAPMAAMVKAISGLVDARDGGIDTAGNPIPQMQAPLVVVTAEEGIGVAASGALQVAAGEAAHVASGRDTQIAAGADLSVHSGQAIGLLAGAVGPGEDGSGISLLAGQGEVQLQAHGDAIELAAQDLVQLISANSHVDFAAAKSITLCTEGGASLTIADGNITVACPGTISIKGASKSFDGPASLSYGLPKFPISICKRCRRNAAATGSPFSMVED